NDKRPHRLFWNALHGGPMTELKRELGLLTCVLLVIGNIIGVGIFTTPGEIARGVPSAGWVLTAWLVGGLMTMAGALTYAELGAGVMDAITSLKVVAMAAMVVFGFLIGKGDMGAFHPFFTGTSTGAIGAILAALVPMAFTYSGWNSTVIVAEEVRDPERLIP